jgi:geranylgeranyl diphosphate synthase type II
LYLKALEFANLNDKQRLLELFESEIEDNSIKIEQAKTIFIASGADKITQEAIEEYTLKAFSTLDKMNIDNDKKEILRSFGQNLMQRNV